MVKCILIKREVGNLEKLLIALVLVVYGDGNLKTPSALIARGEAHSNSSITNQTRNMIVDLRINYRVPESKLSIIFGISKRHINKIVSQYKSGIRWDNNLI